MSAFDGIKIGDRFAFGSYDFTAERIKAFARAWDPQRFHVDEAAAAASPFGGLCASGWHTASVMMRLQVDYFRALPDPPRFGPSPGFDDLKWRKPVYAGDVISYFGEITSKRLSKSRPGLGIVSTVFWAMNQKDEEVFRMNAHVFVATF